MKIEGDFEPVIGLEVHIQLETESKIFSSDPNRFGDEANKNVGNITFAHPGTLPLLNKKVIEYGLKMAMALNCDVSRNMVFDRKNYFYPDLPKGYQITQDYSPIGKNGGIYVSDNDGKEYFIKLTKIHLEEDAGKSIHEENENFSKVDLNRAGVPLIEIVTEPVIPNTDIAVAFLKEIRKIVRYLEIGNASMDEGSMRCDANVSVRKKGDPLGEKVEIKNMNSLSNLSKAINYEIKRQTQLLKEGKKVISETRLFEKEGVTKGMRTKETAKDYRYLPDPDICPIFIDDEWYSKIKSNIPLLPKDLKNKLIEDFNLPTYDAEIISEDKHFADYFFKVCEHIKNYKLVSNWMISQVKSYLNNYGVEIKDFPIEAENFANFLELINSGKINSNIANQKLYPYLLEHHTESPIHAVEKLKIFQNTDSESIENDINEVLDEMNDKVIEFHKGKKNLIGLFMGQLMKKTGGKINPKLANELLINELNKRKK